MARNGARLNEGLPREGQRRAAGDAATTFRLHASTKGCPVKGSDAAPCASASDNSSPPQRRAAP